MRKIWRLTTRWEGHCPGGCYIFHQHPREDGDRGCHVPVHMFWGMIPWFVAPEQ